MAKKKPKNTFTNLKGSILTVKTLGDDKYGMSIKVLPEKGKTIEDYDPDFVMAVIDYQAIHILGTCH